jgi:hypothetical protein
MSDGWNVQRSSEAHYAKVKKREWVDIISVVDGEIVGGSLSAKVKKREWVDIISGGEGEIVNVPADSLHHEPERQYVLAV